MYTDFHPLCSDVVRSKQRTGLDNMNDVSNVGGNVLPDEDFSIPTAAELAAPEAAVPAGPNGFELLGLAPELVQAVADMGYTEPTAVQNATIPKALTVDG